jgi:hypothetical protein
MASPTSRSGSLEHAEAERRHLDAVVEGEDGGRAGHLDLLDALNIASRRCAD